MGKGGGEALLPYTYLHRVSWPTSRRHIWCPDASAWWLQLPSSRWHHPTSSLGYDQRYQGGIRWQYWDAAPESKMLPDDEIRLPHVWTEATEKYYQTAARHASHPKPWSCSLCRIRAKRCCWWGCGLAMWARSHCESSRSSLCVQLHVYK